MISIDCQMSCLRHTIDPVEVANDGRALVFQASHGEKVMDQSVCNATSGSISIVEILDSGWELAVTGFIQDLNPPRRILLSLPFCMNASIN